MKLSIKRRAGFVHVAGGQLLRVVKDHGVPPGSQTALRKADWTRPPIRDKRVFAREGDLAIEMVNVKVGKVVGWSYLSGEAIQLHRYANSAHGLAGTDPAELFEPARLKLIHMPTPKAFGGNPNSDAFRSAVLEKTMAVKYGDVDVSLACIRVEADAPLDQEYILNIGNFYLGAYNFVPNDQPDAEPFGHLMYIIEQPKGPSVFGHAQPAKHASDYCAAPFQVGLIQTACGLKPSKLKRAR